MVSINAVTVYISYAWGDDSDAGREREAIVDDLCRSFSCQGHAIGRDKNDVKPGDSIEDYAKAIAKAPLILAVISQRSLRSPWCMLHELFQGYRRRNYDRVEFGKYVAALLLDDAFPDFDKPRELVKYWRNWCNEQKETLEEADPGRTGSPNSWRVLSDGEEMVSKIPDMLGIIKSIAMPRGIAAIRRDDFEEIKQFVRMRLELLGLGEQLPPPARKLDAEAIAETYFRLSRQFAGLPQSRVDFVFRQVVKQVFPSVDLDAQFQGLTCGTVIDWKRLLDYFADPVNTSHLDDDQISQLLKTFEQKLHETPALSDPATVMQRSAILAILVEKKGEELMGGLHVPYTCKAVLELREGNDVPRYLPIEPTSTQIFCFNRPVADRSEDKPGVIIDRLMRSALVALKEQGSAGVEPIIDLFLPGILFDEDWANVKVPDGEDDELPLPEKYRYRLRSQDRWVNPDYLQYQNKLRAKQVALRSSKGIWLQIDEDLEKTSVNRQVRDRRDDDCTVAIQRLTDIGADKAERSKWYRAALASSAPLLMWWHHTDSESAQRRIEILKAFKLRNKKVLDGTGNRKRVDPSLDFVALAVARSSLPSSLVVLVEDQMEMEMNPNGAETPRLFAAAKEALPSLGYGSG